MREEETNRVRFLRTEDGDLSALASAILTDLYRLPPEATFQTVLEGFELELDR